MNLVCIICSDGILPNSEIYTTHCGHLFHYVCLVQWLERSKTCPQCRQLTTEKKVHRIYLNLNTNDHGEDASTIQSKLDNVQFQLMLKEKDVKIGVEKYNKVKKQNITLREEISELESKSRGHDSVVHALKDQISYFKSKAKERDKLVEEISKLKQKQKQLENIDVAVNGSREAVTEMLKKENDVDSLAILVATLKKALLDAEKKKINMEHKFKQLQSDWTKQKKEITVLGMTNVQLKQDVEAARSSAQKQARHSTKVPKRDINGATEDTSGNLSFLNIARPNLLSSATESPSVVEKLGDILQSDSPYLRIKKSSSTVPISKHPSMGQVSSCGMSIFKRPKINVDNVGPSKPTYMMYNGLGGQSKEDIFPSVNKLSANSITIKRHRPDPGILNKKFRKVDSL